MYVTRTLSHYKNSPEALYLPPEGPNSGYLVIQDEESETYSCFRLLKNRYLSKLPFPQNKTLTTRYSSGSGEHRHVSYHKVVFIPVLNQPLSSNRYYAIQPQGSHKGEAFAFLKEEDMAQCCFCCYIRDVKPRPFDSHDMYQQFEIVPYETLYSVGRSFYVKSLADDSYPPYFLRRKGWQIYTKTPKNFELHEAKGINLALCSRLSDFNFNLSTRTSNHVVVGKWYRPFMFIKEGRLSAQMKTSMFYEMTLEQRWERIFEKENDHINNRNVVSVKVEFRSEAVFIGESQREAVWEKKNAVDGVVWFTCLGSDQESVGLNLEIVERMRWEEERFGWVAGWEKMIERVNREEKFEGIGGWRRFGCYVLLERFVLRRMNGSLVLAYDFTHTHQIKTIFE